MDINDRIEDHEERIEDLEEHMTKYDAIITRLDVLVGLLTQQVQRADERFYEAIEGQDVLEERNANAHRWVIFAYTLGCSAIVGVLMFLLGHAMPH
jgi:hypothetical protein